MKRICIGMIVGCMSCASPWVLAAASQQGVTPSTGVAHDSMQTEQASDAQAMPVASEQKLVTADSDKPMRLEKKLGLKPASRFHFNGFLSAGGSQATSGDNSKYPIPNRGAISDNWTFSPNSLIGLQVEASLTKNIAIIGQFVADGDDTNGNKSYIPSAQWAFIRYNVSNTVQFQAGRFRLPLFLYSDTQQVGYSYIWLNLPNEVYRLVTFQNLNGVNVIYNQPLGTTGWNLKVQPFYGSETSGFDLYSTPAFKGGKKPGDLLGTANFNEDNVVGVNAAVGDQDFTLHGSYAHLDLSGTPPEPPVAGLPSIPSGPASFYSVGAKADISNVLAAFEYAHRVIDAKSAGNDVFANLSGLYGMLGYRIDKYVPNFTYGRIRTDNSPVVEPLQNQDSYTLGLDYFLNANVVAKASVEDVIPQDGGIGLFTGPLPSNHAYVYGVELDAIF